MLNILYSLNITHSLLIYLFEELCLLENNLFKYENKWKLSEKGRKKKTEEIISAKEQKNYYLCNKTTSIGVNRVVVKCIFFVIYTASSDYQEHFVDSSYQVSIPHFILKELTPAAKQIICRFFFNFIIPVPINRVLPNHQNS